MSVTVQSRRNRLRSVTAAVLTVLLLVPLGVLFAAAWDTTTDDRARTIREQQGVQYLARLAPLVTTLADAQSAALAGVRTPPAGLAGTVAAVSEIDGRLGATLRTTQRWADLRDRIDKLAGVTGTSLDVYRAHVEVGDLLLALFAAVRDNSRLVSDPDNDIAFLQQAVAVDLPETVAQASCGGPAPAARKRSWRTRRRSPARAVARSSARCPGRSGPAAAPGWLPGLDRLRRPAGGDDNATRRMRAMPPAHARLPRRVRVSRRSPAGWASGPGRVAGSCRPCP